MPAPAPVVVKWETPAADISAASWGAKETPAARARLEGGAKVKRARMAARTPEERATIRAAAGIPNTVR